jgi:hypothetical protein
MANSARISHVVVCVWPNHIHEAAAKFAGLLNLDCLEGPFELQRQGICVYLDWESGIEIVAPINEAGAPLLAFLADHGEGVLRVAFGVQNRDDALVSVEAQGHRVTARYDFLDAFPEWSGRFDSALESAIEEIHGVRLNLCQIEPRQDSSGK